MTNKILSALLILVLFVSCAKEKNLIQNQERLADIQHMLTVQKELTAKRQIPSWTIFDQ